MYCVMLLALLDMSLWFVWLVEYMCFVFDPVISFRIVVVVGGLLLAALRVFVNRGSLLNAGLQMNYQNVASCDAFFHNECKNL